MNKLVFFNSAKCVFVVFLGLIASSAIAQGVDTIKAELSEISATIHEIEEDLEKLGDSINHVNASTMYYRDSVNFFEEKIQVLNGIHYTEDRHLFSYFLGGGFSTFDYSPVYGKLEKGLGFTTGF